jgi:hypothetical protein
MLLNGTVEQWKSNLKNSIGDQMDWYLNDISAHACSPAQNRPFRRPSLGLSWFSLASPLNTCAHGKSRETLLSSPLLSSPLLDKDQSLSRTRPRTRYATPPSVFIDWPRIEFSFGSWKLAPLFSCPADLGWLAKFGLLIGKEWWTGRDLMWVHAWRVVIFCLNKNNHFNESFPDLWRAD